jgi:NADH-quinone oxidoreductase subunit L
MLAPLVVLAIGAIGLGLLELNVETGRLPTFLAPVLGAFETGTAGLPEPALIVLSQLIVLGALLLAWVVYGSGRVDWLALRVRLSGPRRFLSGGMHVDDVYSTALIAPGKAGSAFLAYVLDAGVIDGAVTGVGSLVRRLARAGRRLQTGLVRTYALAFFVGALVLFVYVGFRL